VLLQVAGIGDGDDERMITHYTTLSKPQYKARVLVADDIATNQLVVCSMLKKYNIHADVVSNGAEVIEVLSRLPYDLVFMDCQMPVMDGFEATRMVRDPNSKLKGTQPCDHHCFVNGQCHAG